MHGSGVENRVYMYAQDSARPRDMAAGGTVRQ